jgi:integrase
MGLLGAIQTFGVARGLKTENPVRGIRRNKDRSIERYLTSDELTRLSAALVRASARVVNPYAIAAIKLLLLTGMRKSEVLTLRRSWIDFEHGSFACRTARSARR